MKKSFVLLFIVAYFSYSDITPKEKILSLLAQFDRPTVSQLRSFTLASIEEVIGPIGDTPSGELIAMELFRMSIEEVREKYLNHLVVIYGRDGEFFHDALWVTSTPEFQSRIVLLPAGRGLVEKSGDANLLRFLERHQMNISAIYEGRQKVAWIDSGTRGTIFNNLLSTLVRNISPTDPHRESKLFNLFEGIEGRMFVSMGQPSMNSVIDFVQRKARTNDEITEYLRGNLYYAQLPTKGRERLSIPDNDIYEARKWLVSHVEHVKKWRPRTSLIDDRGNLSLDLNPKEKGDIDPKEHLRMQVRVIRHFLGTRPWLESQDSIGASASLPLVIKTLTTIDEKYAEFERLLVERSNTQNESIKYTITSSLGRLVRDEKDLQQWLIINKLNSKRLAHVLRRNPELFPTPFIRAYVEGVRKLPKQEAHQQKALLACSKLLANRNQ